jgi:hypothetical protein
MLFKDAKRQVIQFIVSLLAARKCAAVLLGPEPGFECFWPAKVQLMLFAALNPCAPQYHDKMSNPPCITSGYEAHGDDAKQ